MDIKPLIKIWYNFFSPQFGTTLFISFHEIHQAVEKNSRKRQETWGGRGGKKFMLLSLKKKKLLIKITGSQSPSSLANANF